MIKNRNNRIPFIILCLSNATNKISIISITRAESCGFRKPGEEGRNVEAGGVNGKWIILPATTVDREEEIQLCIKSDMKYEHRIRNNLISGNKSRCRCTYPCTRQTSLLLLPLRLSSTYSFHPWHPSFCVGGWCRRGDIVMCAFVVILLHGTPYCSLCFIL